MPAMAPNVYTTAKLQTISIVLQQMIVLKQLLVVVFLFAGLGSCLAQVDSVQQPDTISAQPRPIPPPVKKPAVIKDSTRSSPTADSLVKPLTDSLAIADSIRRAVQSKFPLIHVIDTGSYKKYATHPWLPLHVAPRYMLTDYREPRSKDDLFYLMAGIVFCLAFTRAAFPKYFRNLFVLFFRSSLRQKQAREQLLQDNLASLLLNLLYFISMGLFIALWIQYRHLTSISFWILAPVCALALVLVYLGKYLFLLFSGWVFNAKEAAVSYTFIVFMVNKVMGVVLIPFLLILSFSHLSVVQVSLTISFTLVGALFIYRYLVSFGAIRNKLKVNAMHFFLYLCAVEVLPLILIYKVMINYMAGIF